MGSNRDWLNKLRHIYKMECGTDFTSDSANMYRLIENIVTIQ